MPATTPQRSAVTEVSGRRLAVGTAMDANAGLDTTANPHRHTARVRAVAGSRSARAEIAAVQRRRLVERGPRVVVQAVRGGRLLAHPRSGAVTGRCDARLVALAGRVPRRRLGRPSAARRGHQHDDHRDEPGVRSDRRDPADRGDAVLAATAPTVPARRRHPARAQRLRRHGLLQHGRLVHRRHRQRVRAAAQHLRRSRHGPDLGRAPRVLHRAHHERGAHRQHHAHHRERHPPRALA